MKNVIITNNNMGLLDYLSSMTSYFEVISVKGNIKDVAFTAREYLMNGYALAADPLAGRKARPTPYLTVFLKEKESDKEILGDDILRVERFVKVFYDDENFLAEMSEQMKNDFATIDYSLTKACCQQMTIGR